MKLWSCNFNAQLANALTIEGDYQSSISALECGYVCATQISYPELQVFVFCYKYSYILSLLFRFSSVLYASISNLSYLILWPCTRCSLQLPFCTCTSCSGRMRIWLSKPLIDATMSGNQLNRTK